ncbi:Uncharacterized protein LW94_7761 [Fusarium fujikuroi]|nr:Uncharacterized protein LW94_7761 [Fusarium fujikuroi]
MVFTPQLLSSSGEQIPESPLQDGLATAKDSSEDSDHELDNKTDDQTIDQRMSDTEYNGLENDGTMDDEGFCESDTSSTTSLSSKFENYFFWYGREYPSQDAGYSYEPIDPIRMEFWDNSDLAEENPGIDVIGLDIAPIQPDMVPPNLKFQIDDCNEESTFAESSIDYIHARNLGGNVDRTMVTRNAFKTLKPGGIVEFDELAIDFDVKQSDADLEAVLGEWKKFFVRQGRSEGLHLSL